MGGFEADLVDEAWAAVAGVDMAPPPVAIEGTSRSLPSRFAVVHTAVATVATALAAAAALAEQRGGARLRLGLDRGHVAAAVRSERHFRIDDRAAGMGFAPLSRLWRARDGWIRTHANYDWHRDALLRVLDTTDRVDDVASAIARRSAVELEATVFAAGGIAAAVRTIDEWRAHPQGAAVHLEPLVGHDLLPGAAPRRRGGGGGGPMTGVRVLDLTRVIAGPVCTRFLGALGADVLRIDPPQRPDLVPGELGDTLLAKRSALVDLRTPAGADTVMSLVADADVVVGGYRPGALERFGLAADQLATRCPGLVVVELAAWGHTGPWADRRGFDSVVQCPSGIAAGEAPDDEPPGAMPCQLLDHGTGYLAAAAVLDGIRRQEHDGGTHVRRLSLARTAAWITSRAPSGMPAPAIDDDVGPWLQELRHGPQRVTAVRPPGSIDREPRSWPPTLARYAADQPRWQPS